jgi:hypothetical protein
VSRGVATPPFSSRIPLKSNVMNLPKWILGGLIGGFAGAFVWGLITYGTHTEISWIAWGIGALVGIGVRIAAGEDAGELSGATAVVLALLSVLGGKYFATELMVRSVTASTTELGTMSEEDMIGFHARQICEERAAQGTPVVFANGKTLNDADRSDYPPEVITAAMQKWNALTPDERKRQTAEREQEFRELMSSVTGAIRQQAFTASFSPYDLLWFGLAAFTAFRIGSGNESSDD